MDKLKIARMDALPGNSRGAVQLRAQIHTPKSIDFTSINGCTREVPAKYRQRSC